MKRFTNILVVHELHREADETLRRGIELAQRNNATLNVLHVMRPDEEKADALSVCKKEIEATCADANLGTDKLQVHVNAGNKLKEIVACISSQGIDLTVLSAGPKHEIAELFDADFLSKLMRQTECPVWVVRPGETLHYRNVLAAVNAGKENALDCPINKRIMGIASSLAEMEGAQLNVGYVWNYNTHDSESLASELPDDVRAEIEETEQKRAAAKLDAVLAHFLRDPGTATPVLKRGGVENSICQAIKEIPADVVVLEGNPNILLLDVILGNRALEILHQAKCSVFFSRG